METLVIDKQRTKMIAHRGLSGLEAENTMASFVAAGNKSYYGIECDIRRTLDGEYVVIHDEDTSRISKESLAIRQTNYEELAQVLLFDFESDNPRNDLRIPLFSDYLAVCKKYKKKCIIELKEPFSEAEILEILQIIQSVSSLEDCIMISFHLDNLHLFRKHAPTAQIQYLVSKYNQEVIDICKEYCFDVNIHHVSLTREALLEFQRHLIRVNVWTVDNPIIALMLIGWGVDFITTNILE